MSDWREAVRNEWNKRHPQESLDGSSFPLIAQGFDSEEIITMVDTVLSGQLTMAAKVREFEKAFAEFMNVPYSVMVNSGSSANLLMMAVASNVARKKHFKSGDEVLVPAVCWSTSVWPIVQMGLKPVFVDVDPQTLNVDLKDLQKKWTPKTKGMVAVHILGNSAPMKEFMAWVEEKDLILLEDNCESLGSKADGKYLGTFGSFGSYSFYYSHHMTTGEGGMVTCHTIEDADLLRCLRAHGWSRELHNRAEVDARSPDVDPRFMFVNVGYNLRPMDTQAAFGLSQLKRLPKMNETRVKNRKNLIEALTKHPRWKEQFTFPMPSPGTEPIWFGFCALMNDRFQSKQTEFLKYLSSKGVENRPIVSGNFVRQPALKLLGMNLNPELFPGAERVNDTGFFIGIHTEELSPVVTQKLADILLGYDF